MELITSSGHLSLSLADEIAKFGDGARRGVVDFGSRFDNTSIDLKGGSIIALHRLTRLQDHVAEVRALASTVDHSAKSSEPRFLSAGAARLLLDCRQRKLGAGI